MAGRIQSARTMAAAAIGGALVGAPIGPAPAQTRAIAVDPPAAAAHVARAAGYAGRQFAGSMFLCDAKGNAHVGSVMLHGSGTWLDPVWAFDDLAYIGNAFVGVWVLRTSGGLILFDAGESVADARDHIVPGLRALGLDPAAVRIVIVTHGHWDHYGGAPYWQAQGARIALGAADWRLIERTPAGSMERAPLAGTDRADRPVPRRDLVIGDGQVIRLGTTAVTLRVTPGHTPGTLSAIVPAHDGGRRHLLSLLGGTAFPPTIEATDRSGGLNGFIDSVDRLAVLSRKAGAEGIINTHIFVDGSDARLDAARARRPGQPNPFLIGARRVDDYYAMFGECLRAAAARPRGDAGEWGRPLPDAGD